LSFAFIGTDKIRFLGPPRRNEYSRYNFVGRKSTEMDSRPMRRRPYVERVRQPAEHCDENTGWQSAIDNRTSPLAFLPTGNLTDADRADF
jgi:hypothetical protein